MIPQANIIAWRECAPWADDAQVEQDLVLSRAAVELFADKHLAGKFALCGGTALHKLFLQPAYRYSEDIDLVQTQAGASGSIIDAIRANLDSWLGQPRRERGRANVTLTYRFESELAPVRPLRLKIEINTREHFALLGLKPVAFAVTNPWFSGKCEIATFEINELLATKLRALYQRRKGRDLFDLWLCIDQGLIEPQRLIDCFVEYMRREGHPLTRSQFEQNLTEKESDTAFLSDIGPLLRPGLSYEAATAIDVVRTTLIELLPSEQKQSTRNKESSSTRKRKKR